MTIIRAIEPTDIRNILRLIDTSWRVHLRISPVELETKIKSAFGFVAEDSVGLRGFMMIEPVQPDVALIVGVGLRDVWSIRPFLELFLPEVQRVAALNELSTLVYVGGATWLVDELKSRGFKVKEWIVSFERLGITSPSKPIRAPAQLRTAHYRDLPTLMALDHLAFGHIWHKSSGNFSEALATAASFIVALIDDQITAYEWCEVYKEHAHLTRLAVHPDYQGRGLGAQLLYQAITDVLAEGANFITLNTQINNHRSQALYERFGFFDTQQRMPVLWKDLDNWRIESDKE